MTTVEIIETAIAKVLTGTPLADAASKVGMQAAALADAIEVYRQAGQRALERHTDPGWWQVYIRFTDWDLVELAVADHLAPLLLQAEADGLITAWWFMRKHPCWRLRLRPGPAGHAMTADLSAALDQLTAGGQIAGWWPGIYEPETAAFGGNPGMDIAHDLLCADSRAIVTMLRSDETTLGRRELSLLLCSTLMRAANLEWYEQGDVWHRLTQERPLPGDIPTGKIAAMADDVKPLLLTSTAPDGPLLGENGPLAPAASWAEAFRRTGRALGIAAREGTLRRGLREIISYLVIFHWNRLGLHVRTQSILASAARTAILRPV
ncbi:thiopeptide-type bacteriocin biosynthesis protein [Actinophytocola sp.]|uniref:thiopeptide-type bacteriocin biosynthesis protein n=1 Tax=Actinophytocola sp. TaxID=1872138 RepID=UPI0025B866FE|nr:thiopeptide-type bacteriocin biosynthesis protein [Actinophytocola sp.]